MGNADIENYSHKSHDDLFSQSTDAMFNSLLWLSYNSCQSGEIPLHMPHHGLQNLISHGFYVLIEFDFLSYTLFKKEFVSNIVTSSFMFDWEVS